MVFWQERSRLGNFPMEKSAENSLERGAVLHYYCPFKSTFRCSVPAPPVQHPFPVEASAVLGSRGSSAADAPPRGPSQGRATRQSRGCPGGRGGAGDDETPPSGQLSLYVPSRRPPCPTQPSPASHHRSPPGPRPCPTRDRRPRNASFPEGALETPVLRH